MKASMSHPRFSDKRSHPDPFPVEVLRRVDRPTALIMDDKVQRVDEWESGFNRALRGDFGPYLQPFQAMIKFLAVFIIHEVVKDRRCNETF